MKIKSAEFLTSAVEPSQYPAHALPEVAFAGRSNVGKSSLINRLLNRKSLAKTSGTPGRTRTINFFLVNDDLCFVDLPGYGWAKVSKAERGRWGRMIETYLTERENLKLFILIVDSRHDTSPLDVQMAEFLEHHRIPRLVVATKADKVKKSRLAGNLNRLKRGLAAGEIVPFSAVTGRGRAEVLDWIARAAGGRP